MQLFRVTVRTSDADYHSTTDDVQYHYAASPDVFYDICGGDHIYYVDVVDVTEVSEIPQDWLDEQMLCPRFRAPSPDRPYTAL